MLNIHLYCEDVASLFPLSLKKCLSRDYNSVSAQTIQSLFSNSEVYSSNDIILLLIENGELKDLFNKLSANSIYEKFTSSRIIVILNTFSVNPSLIKELTGIRDSELQRLSILPSSISVNELNNHISNIYFNNIKIKRGNITIDPLAN